MLHFGCRFPNSPMLEGFSTISRVYSILSVWISKCVYFIRLHTLDCSCANIPRFSCIPCCRSACQSLF